VAAGRIEDTGAERRRLRERRPSCLGRWCGGGCRGVGGAGRGWLGGRGCGCGSGAGDRAGGRFGICRLVVLLDTDLDPHGDCWFGSLDDGEGPG